MLSFHLSPLRISRYDVQRRRNIYVGGTLIINIRLLVRILVVCFHLNSLLASHLQLRDSSQYMDYNRSNSVVITKVLLVYFYICILILYPKTYPFSRISLRLYSSICIVTGMIYDKGEKADPGILWILVDSGGFWWIPMDPHKLFCISMNYDDVVEHTQVCFSNLKKIYGSS